METSIIIDTSLHRKFSLINFRILVFLRLLNFRCELFLTRKAPGALDPAVFSPQGAKYMGGPAPLPDEVWDWSRRTIGKERNNSPNPDNNGRCRL